MCSPEPCRPGVAFMILRFRLIAILGASVCTRAFTLLEAVSRDGLLTSPRMMATPAGLAILFDCDGELRLGRE